MPVLWPKTVGASRKGVRSAAGAVVLAAAMVKAALHLMTCNRTRAR